VALPLNGLSDWILVDGSLPFRAEASPSEIARNGNRNPNGISENVTGFPILDDAVVGRASPKTGPIHSSLTPRGS
jgi:hypothetical protein